MLLLQLFLCLYKQILSRYWPLCVTYKFRGHICRHVYKHTCLLFKPSDLSVSGFPPTPPFLFSSPLFSSALCLIESWVDSRWNPFEFPVVLTTVVARDTVIPLISRPFTSYSCHLCYNHYATLKHALQFLVNNANADTQDGMDGKQN